MVKYLYIPSFFTLLNFLLGFLAVINIYKGSYYEAAWFIILAVLCDGMDGKLARWTGSETQFGNELDSLGDLLSFGVAPAFLIYTVTFRHMSVIGFLVCFIYVLSGGYRLARFNVQQAGNRSQGYIGLPIPVAGMTLAGFWLFRNYLAIGISQVIFLLMVFILSALMISTVHYEWPKLAFKKGLWKCLQSMGLLGAVGVMAVQPQISLFPLLSLYIILGVVNWLIDFAKGKVELSKLFISIK